MPHCLPSVAASVLLVSLCLLAMPAVAIHEDEQGLRDWVMRFVGNVRHAAVPATRNPSHVFVSSAEGAVAALELSPYGALNVTWRETMSEPPICLAASSEAVMVVGERGSVYVLGDDNGFVKVTFLLQRAGEPTSPVVVAACAVDRRSEATVVLVEGATAHTYVFDLRQEEEFVAASGAAMDLGDDVQSAHMAGDHLVVSTADRTTQYDLPSRSRVAEMEGTNSGVASSGEVAVHTASRAAVRSAQGEVVGADCVKCDSAVAVDATTGSFVGAVTAVTGPNGVVVSLPSGEVTIQTPENARGVTVLAAFEKGGDIYALVKAGNRHLYLVRAGEDDAGVVWERREGLANAAAAVIVNPPGELDHFKFNKVALLVSEEGVLYAIPLGDMGAKVSIIADFSTALLAALQVPSMADVTVKKAALEAAHSLLLRAVHGETTALVRVDLETGAVSSIDVIGQPLFVSNTFHITPDLQVDGALPRAEEYIFVAHTSKGTVEGYYVSNETRRASPTWSLRFPYPIIASASGADPRRTSIVNDLHVFPNRTAKDAVEEVRHRYPTRNMIAVAYYEPAEEELPTLVVVAVDTITGSILATVRHPNVEGVVKMVIVENALIYYFLDAEKMRYDFGVWELFEEENGPVVSKDAGATLPQVVASFFVNPNRVFSSRVSRPPVVAAATLGVFGGPVAEMSVTTSESSIARKNLVLAFESGRVAVMEVRRLLAGGQMPMGKNSDQQVTHAIVPSVFLATYKYRLAAPKHVVVEPTGLESSCHVIVSGLDLFYVRSSTGKPFDLLNTDFNKPLLVTLVSVFAGLSLLVRYFVLRKSLNALWY